MNFRTHQVAGLLAAETSLLLMPHPVSIWVYPVSLFGGMMLGPLADVDKKESKIGQILIPLAVLLETCRIRHRSVTHSLLLLIVLWMLLHPLSSSPDIAALKIALLSAYASHTAIDLLNPHGVELLFPLRIRIKLLPEILSIDVQEPESVGETMFRWLMTTATFVEGYLMIAPFITKIPILGPMLNSGIEFASHFLKTLL